MGIDVTEPYRQPEINLSEELEGCCNGCCSEFPFRVFEVDHAIPGSGGGQDNIENL